MSGVEFVASVLAISGAAGKLSLAFYDIASQIRFANTEAQSLGEHLKLFSDSAKDLAATLKDATMALDRNKQGVTEHPTVQNAMWLVDKTMTEIEKCFADVVGKKMRVPKSKMGLSAAIGNGEDTVTTGLSRDPNTLRDEPNEDSTAITATDTTQTEVFIPPTRLSALAKLRWVFNRSKIERLNNTLDRLNGQLILLSQTMALKVALNTQRENTALLISLNDALPTAIRERRMCELPSIDRTRLAYEAAPSFNYDRTEIGQRAESVAPQREHWRRRTGGTSMALPAYGHSLRNKPKQALRLLKSSLQKLRRSKPRDKQILYKAELELQQEEIYFLAKPLIRQVKIAIYP